MGMLSRSALAYLAVATLLPHPPTLALILAGPTPAMTTNQSFSLNFNSFGRHDGAFVYP